MSDKEERKREERGGTGRQTDRSKEGKDPDKPTKKTNDPDYDK